MECFYTPSLLIKEAENIKNIFPEKGKVVRPGGMDDLLKQLIYALVKLKPKYVHRFGQERTAEEVSSLAGYVCTNSLRVDCTNIFLLLSEYATSDDWGCIFKTWQNFWSETAMEETKLFLQRGIEENNRFNEYFQGKNINRDKLEWIKEKDLVSAVCNNCKHADTVESYNAKLVLAGVIENTVLYECCMVKFYLYCTRKAYLMKGNKELKILYKGLNIKDQIVFLVNFLSELSYNELIKFPGIYELCHASMKQKQFQEMLESELVKYNLLDKYRSWEKRMFIYTQMATMTDEGSLLEDADKYRAQFWAQYADKAFGMDKLHFALKSYHGSIEYIIYFDFGDYVVTEFDKQAGGKAYLFTKEAFEKTAKNLIKYKTKGEFKKYINSRHIDGLLQKMSHNGGDACWWPEFRNTLGHYGIRRL